MWHINLNCKSKVSIQLKWSFWLQANKTQWSNKFNYVNTIVRGLNKRKKNTHLNVKIIQNNLYSIVLINSSFISYFIFISFYMLFIWKFINAFDEMIGAIIKWSWSVFSSTLEQRQTYVFTFHFSEQTLSFSCY